MANSRSPSTNPPEWVVDFCKDYSQFLFGAGKWTLIAGIILGIALAIATVVLLLRKKDGAAENVRAANAVGATAVLDAVKGFLQALSSAPTWLALFGGGVLLLWMAGTAVPEICKPPAPSPSTKANQESQPGRTPGSTPDSAGNDVDANRAD